MEKIKNQCKAFWNYFLLMRCGANNADATKSMRRWMLTLIVTIIAIMTIFSQAGIEITFYAEWFIAAAIVTGATTAIRPSALSVAPFSPKQRIVFSFLSTLLMALIFTVIIFLLQFVFFCIIAFIAFCVDGENLFAEMGQATFYSAYGNAFIVLMLTLFFFAAYAIFHLNKGRNMAIAAISFFALMEIFILIMTNVCGNAWIQDAIGIPENSYYQFYGAADVPAIIGELAQPWVPILVLCIANVLAIAAAVLLTIRRFKSDKI